MGLRAQLCALQAEQRERAHKQARAARCATPTGLLPPLGACKAQPLPAGGLRTLQTSCLRLPAQIVKLQPVLTMLAAPQARAAPCCRCSRAAAAVGLPTARIRRAGRGTVAAARASGPDAPQQQQTQQQVIAVDASAPTTAKGPAGGLPVPVLAAAAAVAAAVAFAAFKRLSRCAPRAAAPLPPACTDPPPPATTRPWCSRSHTRHSRPTATAATVIPLSAVSVRIHAPCCMLLAARSHAPLNFAATCAAPPRAFTPHPMQPPCRGAAQCQHGADGHAQRGGDRDGARAPQPREVQRSRVLPPAAPRPCTAGASQLLATCSLLCCSPQPAWHVLSKYGWGTLT